MFVVKVKIATHARRIYLVPTYYYLDTCSIHCTERVLLCPVVCDIVYCLGVDCTLVNNSQLR